MVLQQPALAEARDWRLWLKQLTKKKFFLFMAMLFTMNRGGLWASEKAAPLTLTQVTALALRISPAVQAAEQDLVQAQARLGQAQAARNLQVSFSTTATGSNGDVYLPPPSRETFDSVQNTVTIPIPIGSKLKNLEGKARNEYEWAEARLAQDRLQVAAQAQDDYFGLLWKKSLVDIAKENLEQAETELDVARKRYAAGDAPELDVLKARVPVAVAKGDLLTAESNYLIACQTLDSLMQLPLEVKPEIADIANPPFLAVTLSQAQKAAVANSPSVQAAMATLRASQAALLASRQGRMPDFSFQASDLRSGDLTAFSRLDSVGVSLTFPLLDGGLVANRVKEQEGVAKQAEALVFQAKQEAELGASSAFVNAQSALAKIPLAETAVDVAKETLNKTREGYAEGLNPIIDVLNAQRAYNQTRIEYAQAIYQAASAAQELNRALGKEMP